MTLSPNDFLRAQYAIAETIAVSGQFPALPPAVSAHLDVIIRRAEASKGVLTVYLTSLVYKCLHAEQDIRRHQSSIEGGYSGRTFDSQYITPFLRSERFPSMAESGWLTRSLEQKVPYDRNYTGSIRPTVLKDAFLSLLEYIENGITHEAHLALLQTTLAQLIRLREKNSITLATPRNLTISQILHLLEQHFGASYQYEGASRLPVLAIYSIYEVLMQEVKRFEGKQLLSLESHTSADRRSGRMGDVDINTSEDTPYEAIEIKHGIPISLSLIEIAYEKFMETDMKRYYILSTAGIVAEEAERINERILDIKNTHGCQIIANGIFTTLTYYLRLLYDPALFLARYVANLKEDKAIKYEHKAYWNRLVEKL